MNRFQIMYSVRTSERNPVGRALDYESEDPDSISEAPKKPVIYTNGDWRMLNIGWGHKVPKFPNHTSGAAKLSAVPSLSFCFKV